MRTKYYVTSANWSITSVELSNQNKHGDLQTGRQDAVHLNSTFASVSLLVRIAWCPIFAYDAYTASLPEYDVTVSS